MDKKMLQQHLRLRLSSISGGSSGGVLSSISGSISGGV